MLIKTIKNLNKSMCILLLAPCAFAAPAVNSNPSTHPQPSSKPVFIHSDQSNFNLKTHVTVYSGNVTATHGDSQLTGKQLTLISDQHNQLVKMITTGDAQKKAVLVSKEPNQPAVNAQSNTILYYPQQHMAVLVGQAVANQGNDQIQGPILNYDVKNKVLIADKVNGQAPLAFIENNSSDTSNKKEAGKG